MKLWHNFIHPLTSYFRKQRGTYLRSKFPELGTYHICDLGGSRHFWEKLSISDLIYKNITIYNISAGETQSIHSTGGICSDIKIVIYDGLKIPVADATFDLLVCNSVLEHVPPQHRAKLVIEMKRVAKRIFIQTPAYSFPIEPHFIMPFVHWLPRSVGFWLIHCSPWRLLSRPSVETIASYYWGTQLLRKSDIEELFPGETIQYEKFFGIIKSYYVVS
ncbi:methyltransferase domain-containing protein [bacterium]|jgi:hypothetical protein|nr:methyltransferase domain-containing protein [bacterium]